MSVLRTLRTARQIPASQLVARARTLWRRRRYAAQPGLAFADVAAFASGMEPVARFPQLPDEILWPEGLDAVERRAKDFARGRFVYLNREADFAKDILWRDGNATPLWRYQLHYLGCVADLARTGRIAEAAIVLASWRAAFEGRWHAEAWHPYPASLRFVNLCVAAACAGGFDELGPGTARLAATHAAYLLANVEHDVRGNHILENARALLWAGRVFRGGAAASCERAAREILEAEVPEQVLEDGGHFEMSPMYHCIVLRDLAEMRELLFAEDALRASVCGAIDRMAAFLAAILCPDGDIPLLGDSVRNFGPPPRALLRFLGTTVTRTNGVRALSSTGLHVLRDDRVWAIFDAGPVCPAYLPAHGQADTLTVEVWVDGTCVVCDPGVHDYTGDERAWGRSSRAHSTVTVDGADTSEVYGSFRVGGRARIESVGVAEDCDEVVARMRPYGSSVRLSRSVRVYGNSLTIEDTASGGSAHSFSSRVHLAPDAGFILAGNIGMGLASGAHSHAADVAFPTEVHIEKARVSPEFGRVVASTILCQTVPVDGGRARWVIGPP